MKVASVVSDSVQSMEFSRPEYWSGQPFPSPGIFPTQESSQDLLHCRWILYQLSYQGNKKIKKLKVWYKKFSKPIDLIVLIKQQLQQQRGKKKSKKSISNYRTTQKRIIIKIFLGSQLSGSFPLLWVTVYFTSVGYSPTLSWSLDLLWVQLRL